MTSATKELDFSFLSVLINTHVSSLGWLGPILVGGSALGAEGQSGADHDLKPCSWASEPTLLTVPFPATQKRFRVKEELCS